MDHKMAILSGPQANQSVVPCPRYAKERTLNKTHNTNGWENWKNPIRVPILLKTVCYNSTKQKSTAREDDETGTHII
jgi:hypothetical protein